MRKGNPYSGCWNFTHGLDIEFDKKNKNAISNNLLKFALCFIHNTQFVKNLFFFHEYKLTAYAIIKIDLFFV